MLRFRSGCFVGRTKQPVSMWLWRRAKVLGVNLVLSGSDQNINTVLNIGELVLFCIAIQRLCFKYYIMIILQI